MGLFNVSNQQLARKTSHVVYKNLYQKVLHKDGHGITDRFVTPEMTNAAMVDIFVPIPIGARFRMRGAETNGLWANQNNQPGANGQRKHVLSKRFTIDILKRYDQNIAVSEDEVEGIGATSLDESFEQICKDQIMQDIAININGYTFASQLYSFFMDSFDQNGTGITQKEITDAIEAYTYDPENRTAAVRAFKLANAKVTKGDSKLYAGYYPADKRQAFLFDTVYLVDLTDTAALSASDIATKMVAGGGMNAFTNEKKTVADYEDGLVGWLDGMPLYSVLEQVKDATYYYLGLNESDDEKNTTVIDLLSRISCLIAPANATIRGLKPTSFKTVDDPDTQGVIIQPKVNMGVRCLSGNSIKIVVNGNPFTAEELSTIRGAIDFKLPNMSYDEDPRIGMQSTISTSVDGGQTLTPKEKV